MLLQNEDEKKSYLGLANFTELTSDLKENDHAVITKRATEPLEVKMLPNTVTKAA